MRISINNILIFSCLCSVLFTPPLAAQQDINFFNKKWEQAKEHLDSNRLEALLTATIELENLVTDKRSKAYGKVAYLQAEYQYANDNWKQTIQYADNAITLLKIDGTNRLLLAESYLLGGLAYDYLKVFDKAIFFYQKALAIKKEILGPYHLKISNIYYNLSAIEKEKRNLNEAIQLLKKGIIGILESEGVNSKNLRDFYNEIAYYYRLKGDFDAALDYQTKQLAIAVNEYGPQLLRSGNYLLLYRGNLF